MDKRVQQACRAALETLGKVTDFQVHEFKTRIEEVFELDLPFMDKVAAMDQVIDEYEQVEPLREVFFDLLLMNFFTEDVQKLEADYLDSEEWESIEDDTLDRGTELLNILLYLKECDDENIDPDLADYLKEFLLVDEDEFQDEYRIYEDVIANQILVESSYEEIAKVAKSLDESSEMKELFYPVLSFFYEPEPSQILTDKFIANSQDPEFEAPVYSLLVNFNKP